MLYISNKTEHFSYKKWVCHTGGKAFERGLACSAVILMMTRNDFCTTVKMYLLKCKGHLKTILNAYALLCIP